MRITTRLRLISTVTLGALLLVVGLLAWSFAAFRQAKNDHALTVQLKVNHFERTSHMDQYFLYREDWTRILWLQSITEAKALLRQGTAQFKVQADRATLDRIQVQLEESAAIFKRIVDNSPASARGGHAQVFAELDKRLASQLLVKAAMIRDTTSILKDTSEARAQEAYQRLALLVTAFAVGLGLATSLTLLQLDRLIRSRLVPLHAGVRAVAGGDLEFRLDSAGSDEFAELAQAINAMTGRLQTFTQQAEAASSERKLSEVLEEVDACIYLKDRQGRYLFGNRLARQWFGVAKGDLAGRGDADFFEGKPLVSLREQDRQVLEEGRTVGTEETRSGAPFWTVKHPLRDGSGAIYGLCGVSTDLTHRKRLEAELNQAQKMQSLGSLAGGVAHDMNNVLGAILGLATAHLTIQPVDSPSYRAFETIAKAATRGGTMVKSLLSFARQTPAENLPLDLNQLLTEAARLLEHTTLAKIGLKLELEPELHLIRGDAGALSHAFMNLCVNAVDAMAESGVLTLRTRNLGPSLVEVLVQDTGSGMSPEILSKALDPFFTTKTVGKGTGLGLSMAYSTMAAHRGQLLIESETGQGTQVRLRFPACAGTTQSLEPELEASPATALGPLNVFLVDDDKLVQSSIQLLLGLMGHLAFTASSGEEALALLAGGYRPDLVILDLNMPGLGGAGTLPRLRALCPELPVLLATGRTDQTALDLVAAHTQVTLMAKPFTMAELQGQMRALRHS